MSVSPSTVVICPHAPPCPGCPLLEFSYEEQLKAKADRVRNVVADFVEIRDCPVVATTPAEPIVGYRSRAKLVVEGSKLGLFERGSHRVIDIPECRVLEPSVALVADVVRRALPLAVPLRALDVQRVDGGVLATLVVPNGVDERAVRDEAARLSRETPELVGVSVSYRDEGSHRVLGRTPRALVGVERTQCRVSPEGPFHYASPGGFAQAHTGQQRALHGAILALFERHRNEMKGARVLELYAGSGALALGLAGRGAKVLAAEAFEPAARLARDAAQAQSLGVTVEARDAADVTRRLVVEEQRFDVVIVNPPRRGLPPEVRADIARLGASLVVYVSCEPATLARDLADLGRRGVVVRSLSPYDMMPLTEEVETLAVLAPGRAKPPEVIHADERLIAVVKSPHEPTISEGEHVGSLLGRVRDLADGREAVPVHRLDPGTSGVCLFARRPEHVAALVRALREGEKEYVALARGIVRDKGAVNRPLTEHGRAQAARTRYTRREVVSGHSLISVRPDEGRKHQIRRHLASLGHPVVGDDRYGDNRTNHHFASRHFLDRAFLHCARIRLASDERELVLTAPLAPDLALVLASLRVAALSPSEDGPRDP